MLNLNLDWVLIAYWVCFVVGSGYALLSALLGGVLGLVHGGDIGGGHFDVGHDYSAGESTDIGHGDAFSAEASADIAISPLSPATISVFMATFGGVGVILTTLFKFNILITLPISAAAGFLVASVVFIIIYRLSVAVQASSEPRLSDAIGAVGQVTIPIAKDGMGEIAYVSRGNRVCLSARAQEGEELAAHTPIKIVRIVGNTAYVAGLTEAENQPTPPKDQPINFKD